MTHKRLEQFREAGLRLCLWTQRNAVQLSGGCGLAAGAVIVWAGASNFDNPALIPAGVLEWTSFLTNLGWGRNDEDKEGDSTVKFSLTKGLMPWRYPVESFMLQQGMTGPFYAIAGLSLAELFAGNISSTITAPELFFPGLLTTAAPIIERGFKEREGWRHPRTLSSGCLFISTIMLGTGAIMVGNTAIIIAAGFFAACNVLTAVSRRRAATPAPT